MNPGQTHHATEQIGGKGTHQVTTGPTRPDESEVPVPTTSSQSKDERKHTSIVMLCAYA